jgi:transposase
MHTVKKITEALVVASKENGLAVNVVKTKYMVMSRDQHTGKNHNRRISNKSFNRVEQFTCLGIPQGVKIPFMENLRAA